MGKGGKSSQQANTTTHDNDIVAGEGAIAMGEGASYSQEMQQNEVEVEGGVGMVGDGSTVEANFGTSIGPGGLLNNGLYLAENSQYSVASMDDNTAKMLDSALALVGHNADNMMRLAAEDQKRAESIQVVTVPSRADAEASREIPLPKGWPRVAASILAAVLVLFFIFKPRGSKSK